MSYATKKTVERLAKELNLHSGDVFTQDWGYEVADPNRLEDFFDYYINNKLSSDEKRTLMQLILESYNDYVGKEGFNSDYSSKLRNILEKDLNLYRDLIDDWSCDKEDLEDCYEITPLIREIRKN